MSKKIRFGKLIVTGLIWIPLYLEGFDLLCSAAFRFSPLALGDWQRYFGAFLNSDWVIQSGRDWLLLLAMILFIPLLFMGWYACYKIHWKRLILRRRKVSVVPPPGESQPQVKKSFKPTQLRIQSGAIMHVNPAAPMAPQATSGPTAPDPQPPRPTYPDEAEVQEMMSSVSGIGADFFPHISLDGHYASFALSTDKKAAVVQIINRPESTLAADTDIDISESDWFYEAGSLKTPAKDVIAIARNLHENEPDSVTVPVVLLMGGTLLNIDETLTYFEKNNVLLLRTENVDADSVPLFSDFLTEFFMSEEDQNMPPSKPENASLFASDPTVENTVQTASDTTALPEETE